VVVGMVLLLEELGNARGLFRAGIQLKRRAAFWLGQPPALQAAIHI
jgi:hypothetical protein